jgi:hypothetical protein
VKAAVFTIGCILAASCGAILLKFGTLSPCGIVREQLREEGIREGSFAGVVAAVMPDSVLDAMITAAVGTPTPGRCLALLVNHRQSGPSQTQVSRQMPIATHTQQPQTERLAGSMCYMGECFDQYILRTAVDVDGVITVWVKIRKYNSNEPQVTLGLPVQTIEKAQCKSPGGYIESETHVRIAQPNPQPIHATEPADKLWIAVCRH